MKAVILAAGKSTRTYPLTLTRPKPLLPFLRGTILDYTLETLKDVIHRNWEFTQAPEAFCFGLLEVVDIEQLRLLAEEP